VADPTLEKWLKQLNWGLVSVWLIVNWYCVCVMDLEKIFDVVIMIRRDEWGMFVKCFQKLSTVTLKS